MGVFAWEGNENVTVCGDGVFGEEDIVITCWCYAFKIVSLQHSRRF